jgi:predicted dehydrogenase/nucleoside-diphosphate-sugar epimerase
MSLIRVGLVGAGFIADIHAEALKRIPGAFVAAIADPVASRAQALAERWKIPQCYANAEDLIGKVDVAHVLVPPNLHRRVAEPLLRGGLSVLLEKPMAEKPEDCAALQDAAASAGVALGVNQNFVFHPAQTLLKAAIRANKIGPVRHVSVVYNMPLRQLDAGQLGHWMFAEPRNLLLEQAVHPLSQIEDLLGPVTEVSAQPQPPKSYGEGVALVTGWLISLRCERGTAQMQFALGQTHPVWTLTAVGDDGMLEADVINSRLSSATPSRWLEFGDTLQSGFERAGGLVSGSIGGAVSYLAGMSGLAPRGDAFYKCMHGSLSAFYRQLGQKQLPRGEMGGRLVQVCCDIAAKVEGPKARPRPAAPSDDARYDVALLGGTGFIGRHTLAALRAEGKRVAVFARSVENLPAPYYEPGVGVFRGSIGDKAAVEDVVRRAPVVVNLAHGGGGANAAAIEAAMVGGARLVAEAVLAAGCEHLVFVSSIAALNLAARDAKITADTPPDPNHERRADYARAKALADLAMLDMHRQRGLPVSILRPGVVLGAGTSPFHSGIGLYNRQTHCIGWNDGQNPLPLVLGEDVASAIAATIRTPEAIGKTLNLVGDVRLSARDYTRELGYATGRPLVYHPQPPWLLQGEELLKWCIKRVAGRRLPLPPYHDLKSRGLVSQFDCTAEKALLQWQPEADRDRFLRRAFAGYGN